jgi:inosine-uridine nucleoside N-ribohydrolase
MSQAYKKPYVKHGLLCLMSLLLFSCYAHANPIIIDTDLGMDDWQAITYILAQPAADVKAITIEADGENNCQQGLAQLKTVLTLLRHESIPVACGRSRPLKGMRHFPAAWSDESTVFFKSSKLGKPERGRRRAAALLIRTLEHV